MAILYLLDTYILLALLRDSTIGARIRQLYNLFMIIPCPIYSVVTEAELRSLAAQGGWEKNKLDQMEFYLQYFERHTIELPKIISAYANIDAHSIQVGRSMGKNDLWIAATANALDAHLLTTDRDFDHLNPLFLTHTYIDPEFRPENVLSEANSVKANGIAPDISAENL